MKQILFFFALLLPVCAFSQLNESFDGPAVNTANPWNGRLDMFTLHEDDLLQFDGSGLTGNYSVYVPISYTENMEWSFDVTLNFNPSNSNQVRLYVYATDKPSDVAYFVQVGHNDDNISFYRQKGNEAPVRVINGQKGLLNKDESSVRIRLTLERNRTWTLYSSDGDHAFVPEGVPYVEKNMLDIRPGGFLNITCRCKALGKENMLFFFDNIKVSSVISPLPEGPDEGPDEEPDTKPSAAPSLRELSQESETELLMAFDKPVNVESAFFSLTELGEVEEIYISDNDEIVKLVWSSAMSREKEYTLTYSGITDTSGNECQGTKSFSSRFGESSESPGKPSQPTAGSLLINEIMADPKGAKGLPETEYVELYNASDMPINLEDWSFLYGGKSTALTNLSLPSGGYVVLYKGGREIDVDEAGSRMPLDKFPAQLANSGKLMQLKSPSGTWIDEFTYEKAKPGISWERSADGWYLSTDEGGGTPGKQNSEPGKEPEEPEKPGEPEKPVVPEKPEAPDGPMTEPNEVVFNELLPNPFAGGSEYIELYNRSERTVSLSGLAIAVRKADGTLSTHYPLSSLVGYFEPAEYRLLTKSKEDVLPFYLISKPEALYELKLPVLANTTSTLVLFRTKDNVVIDEICYSSKWHAASMKDEKGVALERIDPDKETQDSKNWTSASATAQYGTPGYSNSQFRTSDSNESTGIELPEFSESTGEYFIAYRLDEPGYTCRARIFDTTGRYVAEIANQDLLGTEGRLIWNGMTMSGSRLRTGLYILYIELFHMNGQTKSYKKAFLVH